MSVIECVLRIVMVVSAALALGACGGGTSGANDQGGTGASAVPDINAYPPMANNAPPGASVRAIAAASAIGRGVNFGNMLDAPTEGAWGLTVTDDFIDKVAAAGFTSVRLPVRWSNHAGITPPYSIDPAFMARVESVVDKLMAKGLLVVMNMHHHRQLDGDPLDQSEFAVPENALDVRFVMMWEQIAERFKGHSDKLLFELYNEPHGRIDGEPWNVLAARALGVVRKTNPDRVVVIGPTGRNSPNELRRLKMPNDANLIATVHSYVPFEFTHQGADWVSPVMPVGVSCCNSSQQAQMLATLDLAKAWSRTSKYPVFVGEFGAHANADEASRVAYNRFMRDAMEARDMSWAYWQLAANFGIYDTNQLSFRPTLLESLLGR